MTTFWQSYRLWKLKRFLNLLKCNFFRTKIFNSLNLRFCNFFVWKKLLTIIIINAVKQKICVFGGWCRVCWWAGDLVALLDIYCWDNILVINGVRGIIKYWILIWPTFVLGVNFLAVGRNLKEFLRKTREKLVLLFKKEDRHRSMSLV